MDDDQLKGEVTLLKGDEKSQIDISRPILKAIYDTIVAPKEFFQARRRSARVYTENDVAQLVEMVKQWSSSFSPLAFSHSVSISFSVGGLGELDNVGFSTVDEFLSKSPRNTNRISALNIVFDFLIANDGNSRLDSYWAEITLDGGARAYMVSQADE